MNSEAKIIFHNMKNILTNKSIQLETSETTYMYAAVTCTAHVART